jgi:hypothetical protein
VKKGREGGREGEGRGGRERVKGEKGRGGEGRERVKKGREGGWVGGRGGRGGREGGREGRGEEGGKGRGGKEGREILSTHPIVPISRLLELPASEFLINTYMNKNHSSLPPPPFFHPFPLSLYHFPPSLSTPPP